MLPRMKRRSVFAFIWFWGLWSTGSTLEFFGVMPMWPAFLIGVAVAALLLITRSHAPSQVSSSAKAVQAR